MRGLYRQSVGNEMHVDRSLRVNFRSLLCQVCIRTTKQTTVSVLPKDKPRGTSIASDKYQLDRWETHHGIIQTERTEASPGHVFISANE